MEQFTPQEFEAKFSNIKHAGLVLLDGYLSYVPNKSRKCIVDVAVYGESANKLEPVRIEMEAGTKVVDIVALLDSIDHPITSMHVEAILNHLQTLDDAGELEC